MITGAEMDIGSSLALHVTLLNAPQWLLRLCCDSSWFDRVGKKPSVKPYLHAWPSLSIATYIYCYIMWIVFVCGYIKLISAYCDSTVGFC